MTEPRDGTPELETSSLAGDDSCCNRLTRWYEKARRPRLILAAMILFMYGPFVVGGFTIDDYRMMCLMRDYSGHRRTSLDLYKFLSGGEDNRRQRAEGRYPWWLEDDVIYRHWRPLAEAMMYAEYRVFQSSATAYRALGLCLYILGVWAVFGLFRAVGDERLARWAALIFAVAAWHAVPVVFLSAQGDLVSLILVALAFQAILQFVKDGGIIWLASAAVCYAVGLGVKEGVLASAIMPICAAIFVRRDRRAMLRAFVATALLGAIGLVWLRMYTAGSQGPHNALMLNPRGDLIEYLIHMPARSLLLLTSWLIPVNPFLFYFQPSFQKWMWVLGIVGAGGLFAVFRTLWRGYGRDRRFAAVACWVLPFLPLLACTPTDDRVMMLPSIGLSLLAAMWLTLPRPDGSPKWRVVPLLLFLAVQAPTAMGVAGYMRYMGNQSAAQMVAALNLAPRSDQAVKHVLILNARTNFEVLFAQDMAHWLTGDNGLRVGYLTDVPAPRVSAVDAHTLRIEATDTPLFSTFIGEMGRGGDHPRRVGDVHDAGLEEGGFEGRIVACDESGVGAVELHFARRLDEPGYFFVWYPENGPPERREFPGRP